MANFFKKPAVKAQHSKNGFDMSRRRQMTLPCGMLLPVFQDFAYSGDSYKLNSNVLIRTEAVETAALVRLQAHVDHFFVPMNNMYSLWCETFFRTNDIESSIYDQDYVRSGVNLPVCDVSKFLNAPLEQPQFGLKSADNQSFYGYCDEMGVPKLRNFRRLWDLFGYGSITTTKPGITSDYTFLPYFAYHKIFYSFYNDGNWFLNRPELYNFDKFYKNHPTPDDYFDVLTTIHYRPFEKDYFTNVFPQPLFGYGFANAIQGSFMSGYSNNVDDDFPAFIRRMINPEGIVPSNNDLPYKGVAQQPGSDTMTPNINMSDGRDAYSNSIGLREFGDMGSDNNLYPLSTLNTADLRTMFALDKMLRVTALSGNHYEEQVLAHFGYDMPKGISKEAYYIGSQHMDINIGEVVATATTDPTNDKAGMTLGDIAGKGFGRSDNNGDLDFTCPCDGIIMSIISISAKPMYASQGCEVQNRYRDSMDFFHPEFDNLGMQPMFGMFTGVNGLPNSENVFGWTYRYAESKTSFDVVNESFWDTFRESWTCYKQSGLPNDIGNSTDPFYLFFVSPQYTNTIFLMDFLKYDSVPNDAGGVNPFTIDCNGIFNKYFNEYPELTSQQTYGRDNFIADIFIKAYKSSIMSVHSLPKML